MDYIDLLLWNKRRKKKYFMNPLKYAQIMKKKAIKILGEAKVILFGSIVTGKYDPNSDIDILIIAKPLTPEERSEIETRILESVDFASPFEIHLITESTYENWYKKFIKKDFIVVK